MVNTQVDTLKIYILKVFLNIKAQKYSNYNTHTEINRGSKTKIELVKLQIPVNY